ncbi:hypothetical protein QNO09_03210 [Streptomyces sp. 378]|uniref:hypothetical protein n=1 Tax=Streptomyces sp. 378 TaxID=3049412 RepID=UPI0024C3F6B4|nr:hypothetical protein [Streptomyces sp. 378]MDK1342338.1 hypothetical protein [Streptomyces sp. 378]
MSPEQELLEKMGLTVRNLQGGCCGLAGSWGFEDGKYDISMDCGEQALLPAVRDADDDCLVVADGFSCKTQIKDAGTGRQALHIAEVMKLARAEGVGATSRPLERGALRAPTPPLKERTLRVLAVVGLGAAIGAAGVAVARR